MVTTPYASHILGLSPAQGLTTRLITPGLAVPLPSPKRPLRAGLQGNWERRNRQDVFKDPGSSEGRCVKGRLLPTAEG